MSFIVFFFPSSTKSSLESGMAFSCHLSLSLFSNNSFTEVLVNLFLFLSLGTSFFMNISLCTRKPYKGLKYPWKISFKTTIIDNSLHAFAYQVGRGLLNKLRLTKSNTMRTNAAEQSMMGEKSFHWWNFPL